LLLLYGSCSFSDLPILLHTAALKRSQDKNQSSSSVSSVSVIHTDFWKPAVQLALSLFYCSISPLVLGFSDLRRSSAVLSFATSQSLAVYFQKPFLGSPFPRPVWSLDLEELHSSSAAVKVKGDWKPTSLLPPAHMSDQLCQQSI